MAFTEDQKLEIKRRWCETTDSAAKIGATFGVTKNVIIGIAHRGRWSKKLSPPAARILRNRRRGEVEPRTTMERCAELHARFDAVLAEANGKRLTLPQPKKAARQ